MKAPRLWQRKGFLNYLLLPLSGVFYGLTWLRTWAYRHGLLKTNQAHAPVVIIGNHTVGGAGKTPLLIGLGEILNKHNIDFAVISRGYQGSYRQASNYRVVNLDDDASVVGDEPLLIKQRLNCPLVVSPSRFLATQIIKDKFPHAKIILSDDGLQHYALARDIEIAVTNPTAGGNGLLLPAGPLREPSSRLKRCQLVVANGDNSAPYYYQLQPECWVNLTTNEAKPLDYFNNHKPNQLLAFCGIAHPERFFSTLASLDICAETQAFADHFAYTDTVFARDKTLLMTEKDAVKLNHLTHPNAWVLRTNATLSANLEATFLNLVNPLINQ